MTIKQYFFLLPVLVTALLNGCGTTTIYDAKSIDESKQLVLGDDEVLITGKIIFIENGQSKAPYSLGRPSWILGGREELSNLHIPLLSTEKDGSFYYVVPAGKYLMKSVVPFYYTPYIYPAIYFDAPEPKSIYYLGVLIIDIDTTKMLGGLWGNYINSLNFVEVKDEFYTARQILMEKFPEFEYENIHKEIMERIPGNFPTLQKS
ncbi:MAG: hypothetical protein PVF06_10170 [Gammaproteobacteria bacterium]|jgi:hypothetical protein